MHVVRSGGVAGGSARACSTQVRQLLILCGDSPNQTKHRVYGVLKISLLMT